MPVLVSSQGVGVDEFGCREFNGILEGAVRT